MTSASPAAPAQAITLKAGPYGVLRVAASPDLATGALRCRVDGVRVAGVFTLVPAFAREEVDPTTTKLTAYYGDGTPSTSSGYDDVPERPVINCTVTLWGATTFDALKARGGARTPYALGVHIHRSDPGRGFTEAPTRTQYHAVAILATLATHWLQRPDLNELRLAAARHTIHHERYLDRVQREIAGLRDEITQTQREITHLRARHGRMQQLLNPTIPAPDHASSRHP
ncbi:hypothetical protein ACFV1N_45990 [Streptosporangium canum]|uniref:hypothetical protein n=1 Tax=Streptosporangium canum TaxID=324952 RepID=UPI0036BAAB1D